MKLPKLPQNMFVFVSVSHSQNFMSIGVDFKKLYREIFPLQYSNAFKFSYPDTGKLPVSHEFIQLGHNPMRTSYY
jgi:hypothetical protein